MTFIYYVCIKCTKRNNDEIDKNVYQVSILKVSWESSTLASDNSLLIGSLPVG